MKSEVFETIKKYSDRKTVALCALIIAGGLALWIYDYFHDVAAFNGKIYRPESEKTTESVYMQKGHEEKEEISVNISPRQLSDKEAMKFLEDAKEEMESTYLGKNKSVDMVSESLDLRKSYAGGMVGAEWSFSDGRYIKSDGTLIYDEIEKSEEEVIVTARATLKCSDKTVVEEYPVEIVMPSEKSREGFEYYLNKALTSADENGEKQSYLKLPSKIGTVNLSWSKKWDSRGIIIAVLGILAGVGIILGRREEERRQENRRQQELDRDYPGIVSMLSLYVSAGVTVRSAFKRIFSSYIQSRNRASPQRIGYESLGMVLRKMDDGMGELEAYSDYGRITGNENYIKLSLLLTKNLKRGQSNLAALLEKEEAEAFFQRKMNAKRLGEEASTKLLIPMIMLLGVVLVIMIAPAMFSLQM